MSKRAEEAAKAYEESLDYYHCMNDWPSIAYRAGYEQAEKDTIERAIAWLKSLPERFNLPPKQEWSEEDRDRVAQYLHDRDGGMLWSKATEITSDILDIIRPRPSWKPSENQMSMLLAVVNDPNNAGSESCHLSLKSLYNDLKKL